ncbi:hypothetical protein GCM10029976_006360 [Kribbella albertanoniae]
MLFQIRRAIGRSFEPTEPAHSSVPAGIEPICRGSSKRVAQHRPWLLAASGSATTPTSAKLAPLSVLSWITPTPLAAPRNETTLARMRPLAAPLC